VHNNELLISFNWRKTELFEGFIESTTSSFKIQLSLDRAISDLNIVNIELVSLLKMDSKTKLEIKVILQTFK
jgi:hypothetical protein